MADLSDAQKSALKWAVYSSLGDKHFCHSGDVGVSTIRSLIRKGYLEDDPNQYRYWLTQNGEDEWHRLNYRTCTKCGAETHDQEAACLACGHLKDWAKDDLLPEAANDPS
jgi:hypothetical protein